MRNLRSLFRLSRVGLHLLQGMVTVAFFYPWLGEGSRLSLKQRWSAQLLKMLGLRIQHLGEMPRGLIVANHISFLDIFVLNALAPAAFVAKDDVRSWPLIGWLCQHTGTIFMERGNRAAAQRTRENMSSMLQRGKRVALFPEGTTSTGEYVLPFHGALFQPAIDSGVAVQPVLLRYVNVHGEHSPAPAYIGEISLLSCLWAIASETQLTAVLRVLPQTDPAGQDRRSLAAQTHRHIALAITPGIAPATRDVDHMACVGDMPSPRGLAA